VYLLNQISIISKNQKIMSKILSFTVIIFFFLTPSSTRAQEWYQWYISNQIPSGNNIKCQLLSSRAKEVMYYRKRRWGINMSYTKSANVSNNITIKDENNDGQLETWENVAIHVEGGGYLKYESRPQGINLVWSSTPVYEWGISENNKAILPVASNKKYGLYNQKISQYLVYGERRGDMINLVWQQEY
jgi:hypothetical protein